MDLEILAYIGAALMVVLAFLAYRYWRATAKYTLRMREARAHQLMPPARVPVPAAATPVEDPPPTEVPAGETSPAEPSHQIGDPIASGETDEDPHPADDIHDPAGEAPDRAEETASTGQATVPDQPAQEEQPDPVPDNNEDPDETAETMAEHPGGEPPTVNTEDVAVEDTGGSEEEPLPSGAEDEEPPQDPAYRLIEDLEPKVSAAQSDELQGPVGALLKELDEQLAALPSGIALIDLPIVERRRIADRREELLSDRELLLEEKKRGAHRRGRRFRPKKQST